MNQQTLPTMQKNGTNQDVVRDIHEYSQAWYEMMTRIWRDRLNMLVQRDTGTLFHSVQNGSLQINGMSVQAAFRFVEYGVYVDAGTGNGYTRGNGGYLGIKDRLYRKQHKMGKTRERKPWFSKSWAISRKVIADKFQSLLGERYIGMFDNICE